MKRAILGMVLLGLACALQAGEGSAWTRLADAGDVSTPAAAQATQDALAAKLKAQGGGIIVVDNAVAEAFRPSNTYQNERSTAPAVTLIDIRRGELQIHTAPIGYDRRGTWAGLHLVRTLNLGTNASLPHWGSSEALHVENNVIAGSMSIIKPSLFPVSAGKDARLYPAGIEGFFPGARINFGREGLITVKAIGWDEARKLNYVVADLKYDHHAGENFSNKHWTPAVDIVNRLNADNQSGMFSVEAEQYGVGDCFLISGMMKYQGNVFSGGGDEGGVVLNAETVEDLDPFASTVEAWDAAAGRLVYAPGRVNGEKLSMSRPLVNLNTSKWLTAGSVVIVPPDDWEGMTPDGKGGYTDWSGKVPKKPAVFYKGQAYPSLIVAGEGNVLGGLIEGSADAPWDEAVVGRYFAVDDPAEKYGDRAEIPCDNYGYAPFPEAPGAQVHRWYRITAFARRPDGTKSIRIHRIRWACVSAGAPTLFRQESYTWDGHVRPLKYIIAPGAVVCDISQGYADLRTRRSDHYVTRADDPRTLRLIPNGDTGTRFDFAAGDRVLQAVGPDPYQPRPVRIRMFDSFPTTMGNPAIDVHNNGAVTRSAGLALGGGPWLLADIAKRKDAQPAYQNGLLCGSSVGTAVRIAGQVTEAAMVMEQVAGNPQPLAWLHAGATGRTTLGANPASGDLELRGGQLDLQTAGAQRVAGLSATATPARNLRGIAVTVPAGAREVEVRFAQPEVDADYSLVAQPNWFTLDRVVRKTATGFVVQFSESAPAEARLDWQLLR